MDIVFQPSGNFDEVYLYVRANLAHPFRDYRIICIQEELMEADLHAIASPIVSYL